MKPYISSALCFSLLFATVCAGSAHAAESGKEKAKAAQNSAATEADGKAFAAAEALYAAGHYAGAEKAAQALVVAHTQALGAEARETLRARLLLAESLRMQMKDAESEMQMRTLLPVIAKVFGAEDRETLRCQSAVLALCERTFGAQHAETLTTCHHLATYLALQHKEKQALPYAQRAYTGRLKILGRDHEDTQQSNKLVDQLTKQETKA